MIERVFDPDIVNAFANHPTIRPFIGGDGSDSADLTEAVADKRNLFFATERGCAAFLWRGPGIYEGHTMFLCSGREAIGLGRAMLALVHALGAAMIWGLTPMTFRHVRFFNRKLGFSSGGPMETPIGLCELFIMEFPDG